VRHFRFGVLKFISRHSGRAAKVALVDEKSGEVLPAGYPPAGRPGADDLVRWRLTKFGV